MLNSSKGAGSDNIRFVNDAVCFDKASNLYCEPFHPNRIVPCELKNARIVPLFRKDPMLVIIDRLVFFLLSQRSLKKLYTCNWKDIW